MDVRFVDTTLRDGSQSLWAMGMRAGMMAAVAQDLAAAGFAVVEVPVNAVHVKKFVRDLKEDPWEIARMLAKTMPRTVKSCMAAAAFSPFEPPPPRPIVELFYARTAGTGGLNGVQLACNTTGQIKGAFPWFIPILKNLGYRIALALAYSISPRHTDEYYAAKTREILPFEPDVIYLKDQGGLLTVDRLRTLLPVIVRNAGRVPVELHSHCTTGLADLVYLEALALGVGTLHTAIPPLANGSSQPSVFNVARNASLLGHVPNIDEAPLRSVSERLTAIAREDRLPAGAPLEYDAAQYVHQIPGGVISNLRYQLEEMRIAHRLDEVIEESVRVRQDLGYPIMITPHSQFVCTQAAINVATGKRYQQVIDEIILFAQGIYGEDSGHPWMDANLRDRLLALPRARELAEAAARRRRDISLAQIRQQLGGATDEEFLTRYIMKGEEEIRAMRAAGPPRQYNGARQPLLTLIRELQKHPRVRYVQVRRGADSLTVQ